MAALAAVAAALLLPGTASAANPSCGSTVATNVTLTGNMDCSGYAGTALIMGADGITINLNGFTLTGNSPYEVIDNYDGCAGKGCQNVTVTNGTISGGSYGVDSEGTSSFPVSGTIVNGVTFVAQTSNSIYLEYTQNSLVENNTVTDTLGDSITAVESEYSSNDVIQGNTLTGYSQASSNSGYGVYIYYAAGTLISGNTIKAWGDGGIYDDEYSAGVTVKGNVLGGNYYGLYLNDEESGWTVSGNYIKNSSQEGVLSYDSDLMTYSANVNSSNGDEGFEFYNGDYPGTLTVVNNTSRFNSNDGFYLDGYYWGSGSPYPASNSVWSGNTAFKNSGYGFDTYASENDTFTSNTALANTSGGFYLEYPMHFTVNSNTAKYNTGEGFEFADSYQPFNPLSVANNVAMYNTDYGFYGDYPVLGSGNTGGGTNATADCYQFTGCS